MENETKPEYKNYLLKDLPYIAELHQLSEKGFSLTAKEHNKLILKEYSINYNQDIKYIIANLHKEKLNPKLESLIDKLVIGIWKKVKQGGKNGRI